MIQHAGLEVRAADVPACLEFWALLGWAQVEAPHGLERHAWVGRDGFQIHLQVRASPVAPPDGHVALVDPDLEATVARLTAAGYEVLEREQYWGARRILTRCPAGHRVELMSAPPA